MSVRKHYSPEFKAKVVLEILKEEKSMLEISAEYGVHPSQLKRWKSQVVQGLPQLFAEERAAAQALKSEHEKQLQELYAEVGRLTTQLTWLKKKAGL